MAALSDSRAVASERRAAAELHSCDSATGTLEIGQPVPIGIVVEQASAETRGARACM